MISSSIAPENYSTLKTKTSGILQHFTGPLFSPPVFSDKFAFLFCSQVTILYLSSSLFQGPVFCDPCSAHYISSEPLLQFQRKYLLFANYIYGKFSSLTINMFLPEYCSFFLYFYCFTSPKHHLFGYKSFFSPVLTLRKSHRFKTFSTDKMYRRYLQCHFANIMS